MNAATATPPKRPKRDPAPTPEWGILREPQVLAATGYSRPTIWRLEQRGTFPRRIKLGDGRRGAVGWRAADVRAWLDARAEGRDWTPADSAAAA